MGGAILPVGAQAVTAASTVVTSCTTHRLDSSGDIAGPREAGVTT